LFFIVVLFWLGAKASSDPSHSWVCLDLFHSWVKHEMACSEDTSVYGCEVSPFATKSAFPYTTWSNIGYTCLGKPCSIGREYGQGGLVDNSANNCRKWTTYEVSQNCSRWSIEHLVYQGWDKAFYKLSPLRRFPLGHYCEAKKEVSCSPTEDTDLGNICWDFTCSWSRCAISLCPDKRLVTRSSIASSVPRFWNCSSESYNSKDGCHCRCGAWDPDCDDLSQATINCPNDELCLPPGDVCSSRSETLVERKRILTNIEGELAHDINYLPTFGPYKLRDAEKGQVPSSWKCPREYYANDDGCDCNCGGWDPDCQDPSQPVVNCPEKEDHSLWECDYTSFRCKPPPQPFPVSLIVFGGSCVMVLAVVAVAFFRRHKNSSLLMS